MAELWQRGRVTLKWSEQHELHGLEIVMRRRPLKDTVAALMGDEDGGRRWADFTPAEQGQRLERSAGKLAALIIGWNLADESGEAVMPSAEAILSLCDSDMITDMWTAYDEATSRVSPPLPKSSEPGPGEWDLPPLELLTAESSG